MASSLRFTSVCSFSAPNKPGTIINDSIPRKILRVNEVFKSSRNVKFLSFEAKIKIKVLYRRALSAPIVKQTVPNSVLNAKVPELMPVDHFNRRFKAGGLCWLCRGKREILCGNCNGAGFLGGFMSS